MRRVVITGMANISALGNNREEAWERMHKFENAVCIMPGWAEYKGLRSHVAAPMKDYIPKKYDRKIVRTMSAISILAAEATEQALLDAGLWGNPEIQSGNTGVAYGSCSGSLDAYSAMKTLIIDKSTADLDSTTYVKLMGHTVPVNLEMFLKTTGRLIPTSTACTSGSLAIGNAYEVIKYGMQDIMVAGGAEVLHISQTCIFDTLFATTTKNDTPQLTPSPFDKNRDGLVIGEGAGTLILEELGHAQARGAKIYAEVIGFGTNTDGTHITKPNPKTMAGALRLALKDAQLSPDEIGYVNAHGTATDAGDIAETTATREVFGREVPISTLKSYIGHTLGACGAIEAIETIDMMNRKWFCPTLNLNDIDPLCGDLDYIRGDGREISTDFVMSNNFAFGGINTSLIFKKWK